MSQPDTPQTPYPLVLCAIQAQLPSSKSFCRRALQTGALGTE